MKIKVIFLLFFSILLLVPFITKGAVVINEIAWMGTETDYNDEWIELYNSSEQDIGLFYYQLSWSDKLIAFNNTKTNTKKINNPIIPANGYFLLERTDDNSVPGKPADIIYTGALSNSGENLILKGENNEIIDQVDCSGKWFAGNNSTKQTMERMAGGWQTSLSPGGTPKAQNSSGEEPQEEPQEPEEPEEEPQESEEPEGEPEEPEEEPDPPADEPETPPTSPSSNQPPIADADNDIIAFVNEKITFDGSRSYDPDKDELTFTWNLGGGASKEGIVVTHEYSYPGTYLVTLMVSDGQYFDNDTITVEIYPEKITINEFLPSPVGKDAKKEWIELYNDSDQIVDISGWQLDDEDGGSKPFVFPENTLITRKGYLVLSRQTTGIALNNDGDKVRLLLSTGAVFQEISYEKAPEGQSSSRTPEGFVWNTPTPGLPNTINAEEQMFSYNKIANQTYVVRPKSPTKNKQDNLDYYNLTNIEKSTGSDNKLILIIITIIVVASAVGISVVKLKNKRH